MATYYNIPFSFEAVLRRERREAFTCTVEDSIAQNISLIITSKFNEFRYDATYGCEIWEVDFIVPANINIWKEEIKAALEEAIIKYEHRIDVLEVFKIDVDRDRHRGGGGGQVLDFQIVGGIHGTNKKFEYADTLFFSPYSR